MPCPTCADLVTAVAVWQGLVYKHRMFRTLEVGMFQGNTAYHILNGEGAA